MGVEWRREARWEGRAGLMDWEAKVGSRQVERRRNR